MTADQLIESLRLSGRSDALNGAVENKNLPLHLRNEIEAAQNACMAAVRYLSEKPQALAEAHGIEVSVGRMTESNGRVTWMVMLHRHGVQTLLNGHQVYSSHIEGRAQYEAAALRHFLGQGPEPDILDYDTDGAAQADVQPKGTNYIADLHDTLNQIADALGVERGKPELLIAKAKLAAPSPAPAPEELRELVERCKEAADEMALAHGVFRLTNYKSQAVDEVTRACDESNRKRTAFHTAVDALAAAAVSASPAVGAEPAGWAVYWGLPPDRKHSIHFERATAEAAASQIKSCTRIEPVFAAAFKPPVQHKEDGNG